MVFPGVGQAEGLRQGDAAAAMRHLPPLIKNVGLTSRLSNQGFLRIVELTLKPCVICCVRAHIFLFT